MQSPRRRDGRRFDTPWVRRYVPAMGKHTDKSSPQSGEPSTLDLAALVVDLAAIRGAGLDHQHIRAELPQKWIMAALRETDARVDEPGLVQAEVTLQSDGIVLVRGTLAVGFHVPCARCLEPAQVDATTDLCLTFLPAKDPRAQRLDRSTAGSEDEVILEEEDLDTFVFRGTTVDVSVAVAEQVALAYPMRALCERGSACRGLCGSCGADLNALPSDATDCGKCGRPLREVSQAAADRDQPELQAGDAAPWKAALRKLQENN